MLVTADDFERFVDLYQGNFPKLRDEEAVTLFNRLVEGIEPRLVVTEPGGATSWIEAVARARAAVAGGHARGCT